MAFLKNLENPKAYLITFLKWGLLGLLMGVLGGLLGAGFHHALHFVTHLRSAHTWLIFLLPAGGLLSIGIYTLFRQRSNRGTNEIIDAVLEEKAVSPLVAPPFFLPPLPPTCSAAVPVVRVLRCSWAALPHHC